MRTKEFIKRVEELGLRVLICHDIIEIYKENAYAKVGIYRMFDFDCSSFFDKSLNKEIRRQLFELLVEYTSTPIKDRGDESKFYLKHKWIGCDDGENYLNIYRYSDEIILSHKCNISAYKVRFTLEEIEEIMEKFDTDLKDFELVEVKE